MLTNIFSISVSAFILLAFTIVQAENEYWSDLNTPYWTNSIAVAY